MTSRAGATLAYDLNGNLTSDGTYSYAWDGRDQLSKITQGASTVASNLYDPFGRRQKKTSSGATTEYLYDGANPVQEKQAGGASADLVTGLGIDQYHSRTDSSGQRTLLTDALGSTIALTDTAGAVQTSYTYEPFGKTTTTGAGNGNTFQYTGRETDAAGLTYYRARYYSPTLQRFISEDPIGFAGGDVNFYAYVGNTPTNFKDSFGTNAISDFFTKTVPTGFTRLITATRKFVTEHIGEIGAGLGCVVGLATAETPSGIALAATACTGAVAFILKQREQGNKNAIGRLGVGYGCLAGFAASENPVGFLFAVGACVAGSLTEAASEKNRAGR